MNGGNAMQHKEVFKQNKVHCTRNIVVFCLLVLYEINDFILFAFYININPSLARR